MELTINTIGTIIAHIDIIFSSGSGFKPKGTMLSKTRNLSKTTQN